MGLWADGWGDVFPFGDFDKLHDPPLESSEGVFDLETPPETHGYDEFRSEDLLGGGFGDFGAKVVEMDVVVFGFSRQVEDCAEEGFGMVCHWRRACKEPAEESRCRSLSSGGGAG